ncbi:hypothetical protein [Conchiformibius kuhniae]|uniref:Uncharacterized protein n=1 Tax=Conchiformibius kuhniae TaxID=211502 RepID=A0A8T9MXH3_9NEIS|nr:hypothetical protein [Conchiformibius kuhniae]UOP05148.1 hypothetical protein LVJ77_02465 [Conchiformibius kuhniae]
MTHPESRRHFAANHPRRPARLPAHDACAAQAWRDFLFYGAHCVYNAVFLPCADSSKFFGSV